MAMKHLYKIYPKRSIRGIRPKEIMEPTILEGLNRREFLKCFNEGELYAIVNNEEIHLKECNYEKAESLFNVEETIHSESEINIIDEKTAVDQEESSTMQADIQHDCVNKNMCNYDLTRVVLENNDQSDTANIISETTDDEILEENIEQQEAEIAGKELSEDKIEDDVESDEKEKSGNNLQQPQHYNKNHNNNSNQSNYRNHKHGKNNKGKFVINNQN